MNVTLRILNRVRSTKIAKNIRQRILSMRIKLLKISLNNLKVNSYEFNDQEPQILYIIWDFCKLFAISS